MRIEIINTGTELLIGSTVNTNVAWLGTELFKRSLRVAQAVTLPDGMEIAEAIRQALHRADVLIVTGGLGPTSDDLSREALALALGVELHTCEKSLAQIEAYFVKVKKSMPPENRKQALIPEGCQALPNSCGTAPGVYAPPNPSMQRAAIFLLPGPPHELKTMFTEQVLPVLERLAPRQNITSCCLKFCDLGEGALHALVDSKLAATPNLEFCYRAHCNEVDLVLIGDENTVAQARHTALQQTHAYLMSDDGSSPAAAVVALLRQHKLTLSTAESCTGGLIADRITDVPGSSAVLVAGCVAYSRAIKQSVLGVASDLIAKYGEVSQETALAMAQGALRLTNSDLAVASTGIAGPDNPYANEVVGAAWLAVASSTGKTRALRVYFPQQRSRFKLAVCNSALRLLKNFVATPD